MKIILLVLFQFGCLTLYSQTTQQSLLRSQLKSAPERIYGDENSEINHRENRTVLFYDDFSNPSNWTMTNSSSPAYDWEITNLFPSDLVGMGLGPNLNSTSGGNFAIINSYAQGVSSTQNCNLTNVTPIDCSGWNAVRISFESYCYKAIDLHKLLISSDGVNFDTLGVNENLVYIESANVDKVILDISAFAAQQSTVWIRFNYSGAYNYFWSIDDILVENLPVYDMKGLDYYYADVDPEPVFGSVIEHTILPNAQNRPLKLVFNSENFGSDTATNWYEKYEIKNSIGLTLFSDSSLSQSVNPFESTADSLVWTPPGIQEFFEIILSGHYDSSAVEDSPNDLTDTLDFTMTYSGGPNTQFARDNNTYSTDFLWNGSGNAYIMGNVFSITSNLYVYGVDVAYAPGTDPGAAICLQLYELDPGASTLNDVFVPVLDQCLDGVEYTITTSDLPTGNQINWVTYPFYTFSMGTYLQQGKSYLVAFNHYGGTEEVKLMFGGNTLENSYTSWIYDPTATTGGPWFFMTQKPMIRLNLNLVGIEEIDSDNIQSVSFLPNPSDNMSDLHFTMEQSEEVSIAIKDLAGKEIFISHHVHLESGNQMVTVNTNEFASGLYLCTLKSESSEVTIKLQVAH